ncbi:tRNA (cytosine-48,49-C(5)-) methyltransferase [Archaeoglobus sulfaticallidus PM70-1]|uniref:tRNA (Cytosine-48,49-C(5)-) methyltransferase n=1 Tax=Archaeoglobus sulfaticallidus PM70-1 TaxID=387631 RepID=N0BJU0_9EURY|nr:NOL1/NOP2/sun family putative RNA methylase [Archaeoglobus sulfaticallidus]AGK60405.1 tRNA (cytosine-48,49-C(5)-) methyltransferase [Archaeoglobus sulfaticallidus PM70-1]
MVQDNVFKLNPEFFERYSLIDSSDEFIDYMLKPLRKSIRVNTLKADVDVVVNNLKRNFRLERVPWCREGFFVEGEIEGEMEITKTMEHQLGLIFSQEASSMIPPVVLDVRQGMMVLDMAASPGGKTTQIASYMENTGCIIANDVKFSRVNILISNIQKCGVTNAIVTMMDGRAFGRFENTFDRVLLDAPCSNVGMIRKNFKYLKIWKQRDVIALSRLQKQLIRSAYKALKEGGVLVYSTCTLDPEENEAVIDSLLKTTSARVEKIDLPVKRTRCFREFDGVEFDDSVKHCLRIHPQDNDTEGFFVAKIVKEG